MENKLEALEFASARVLGNIQNVSPSSTEAIGKAMRRSMDPTELQIHDLAKFCEQETIRAQQAEAHFAACLTYD